MADKLGLTNEIKEIKLGKSFMKGEHPSFHTFRYDFMPASVDTTKRATVDIGEGHQVTVTVPHIEGSGTANTVFKGSKKPYQKECVLIIDHTTGEITLEKLSYNVQLKKTRAEGSSKIRSSTPIDSNFNSKKSPSAHKLSPQQKPHSTFGRSSPIQKCSPLPKSPLNNQPSPNSSTNHSMPCFNLIPAKPTTIPEASILLPTEEVNDAPEIGVLSSSSSGSSSSEESSESSSSDNEEMAEPVQHGRGSAEQPRHVSMTEPVHHGRGSAEQPRHVSMTEPVHHGRSSAEQPRHVSMTEPVHHGRGSAEQPRHVSMAEPVSHQPQGITNGFAESPNRKETLNTQTNHNISSANSLPSMPKFSQLSEDLKLSESDSDSDD